MIESDLVQAIKLFEAEWADAREAWREIDPKLYAATPPEPVERLMEVTPTPFGALVRSIVHQQVSVLAGRAIARRLAAASGGELDGARILALSDDDLRAAGLSRAKVRYVRALAEAEVGGDLAELERLPDEEIHGRLIALPGVGIWTVKMFLLFHVQRPDVFAGEDLGLREAIRVLDGAEAPPSIAEAHARAEAWAPYRSVAAVSLWDFLRRSRLAKVEG